MNIKEHIEAGHYPKDSKGRARLQHTCGEHVVIYTTNGPDGTPLIGWLGGQGLTMWTVDTVNLLPPVPRKMMLRCWAVALKGGGLSACNHDTREEAEAALRDHYKLSGVCVVTLTGEYEEPWA